MSNDKKGIVYRGILPIGDMKIACAVNEDGIRVISQTALNKAFSRPDGGAGKLPVIIDIKALEPFISEDIMGRANNLIQVEDMKGFEAELIPDICEIWLKARDAGVLTQKQMVTAEKADIIMRALAKVGITALIDEATGYQFNRKHDALRMLLQQYIAEGIQKWLKRFPDKFFEGLDKLYENEKTTSRNRPIYYGNFINKYIYEPLENGFVKAELDKLNITDEGKRKARFHQWLTDFGNNQLQMQIGRVSGIIEISSTLDEFKKFIAKQSGLAIQDDLFTAEEIVNIKKIYKKQQNKEHKENLEVDTVNIMNEIQKENLEFKNNNNFEPILTKIANTKKP